MMIIRKIVVFQTILQINESLFNNKELSITVSRNSEIKTFKIPKVDNTQDYLIYGLLRGQGREILKF